MNFRFERENCGSLTTTTKTAFDSILTYKIAIIKQEGDDCPSITQELKSRQIRMQIIHASSRCFKTKLANYMANHLEKRKKCHELKKLKVYLTLFFNSPLHFGVEDGGHHGLNLWVDLKVKKKVCKHVTMTLLC